MRICVTNDDGWSAVGLRTLVLALSAEHEVLVVAPSSERSGSGTALGSLEDGHTIATVPVDVLGATNAWSVDGPPAMCALIAMSGALGPLPDAVISGINAGHNTSRGIAHSGTFGAAFTAARFGIPAFAISAGAGPDARFDTAADIAVQLSCKLDLLPRFTVLNVNVPDADADDLGDPVESSLAARGMQNVGLQHDGAAITLTERGPVGSPGDTQSVLDGRVTLTAVSAGLTTTDVPPALLAALSTQRPQEDL